jgi:hypothetical protein
MDPGPGSLVPSTPDIKPAVHMPETIDCSNRGVDV